MPAAKKSARKAAKRNPLPSASPTLAKSSASAKKVSALIETTKEAPQKPKVERLRPTPAPNNDFVPKLTNTPDWNVWGKRPVITLRHAISLVHNIHTNSATLLRLKAKKDERTKKFNVDLNTLRLGLPFEASLQTVTPVIDKATNDTEIFLADFVEWIRTKNPFDHLTIPPAFYDLKPPRPGKSLPVNPTTSSNTATVPAVKTRISESNASEFVGKEKKTVARILLALAVKHYGYRPRAATQDGVFAPIAMLCQNFKLSGPENWGTVKSVLAHATSTLDENEINMLLAALDDAKTPSATTGQQN
jgi:hypothetical protein